MNISIITIAFNSSEFIEAAIKSVVSQAGVELEYIIVDGGSTDGSLEIIKRYAEEYSNVIYISEPDNGIYDAINKGIRMASGDVIGMLHSDDFMAGNDVLAHVLERFEKGGVDSVYGDLLYVSGDLNKVIRNWQSGKFVQSELKYGWMPPHPSFFVKKSVYEMTKLDNGEYYDSSFKIAADYDFMTRVLGPRYNISTAYLPEVLVKMRVGGVSNRNLKSIILKMREDYRVIRRNNIGGLYSLACKNLRKVSQFFVKK